MIDNIYSLNKGEILTLMLKNGTTLHAEFESVTKGNWQLKLLPYLSKSLRGVHKVVINFVRAQEMHSADVDIIVLDELHGLCVVSIPESLNKRPLRIESRIIVNLPVSIIRTDTHVISQFSPFRPRSESKLINLTSSGALLACRSPIEMAEKNLILITCFDKSDPHNPKNQVYYRASIKRSIIEKSHPTDFAYCYGVEFFPMLPDNQKRLANFLEATEANQDLVRQT